MWGGVIGGLGWYIWNIFGPAANDEMYKIADFYINGQWGDDNYPAFGKSVQWGHNGDFICQNKTDLTDVWIVKRRLFLNTYQFKT